MNMAKCNDFVINLLIIVFIFGFVSCGKDEPAIFEKGNLIGDYEGSCVISLGSTGSKAETKSNFPAEFIQKDKKSLNFKIGNAGFYESIGISILVTASEFKDYGSIARFSLENINDSFGSSQIPNYIKDNIDPGFEMNNMVLTLKPDPQNPPTYTIATRNLAFTYTGTVEITGKNPAIEKTISLITYTFSLNRK